MPRLLYIFTLFVSTLSIQAEQFKALVFADASDRWHGANVPVAKASFDQLARKHFFDLTWVESDAQFAKQTFANFDVIVFISANPCDLDTEKRTEFANFVQQGGGIVGVHAAAATAKEPNRWLWWETLLGRVFVDHPPRQSALAHVTEPDFPACLHLAQTFLWTDEWYEFETPFPRHLNIVLTVDEKSYKPTNKNKMGAHHPIAWWHEKDGARVFYTALGHITESYEDPVFLQHLYGGIHWAVGERTPEW